MSYDLLNLDKKEITVDVKQKILNAILITCEKWNVNPRIPAQWVMIARRIYDSIEETGVKPDDWDYQGFARALADRIWADHLSVQIGKYINAKSVSFKRSSGIVKDQMKNSLPASQKLL